MAMKKLLIATLLFTSSAAYADNFVVKNIQFEGLQRVTMGAALLHTPVRIGEDINQQDAANIIRSLFATGNFSDVNVLREGSTLLIKVQERPIIANISFVGNKDVKKDQLLKNLTSQGMTVGQALDRTTLRQVEQALEDFYYSVGKYNATVKAVVTPLPRNRVDVKFVFAEGMSAVIKQITFLGNHAFSEKTLQQQFGLKANVPWWDFFSNDKYQKQIMASDLEKLRTFYLNHGYLKYQLQSSNVSISPDRRGIYITLTVNEGQQYHIKGVQFVGDSVQSDAELQKLIGFKMGSVYNGAKITALEEAIKTQLGNEGYAYPTVQAIPQFATDGSSDVSLIININPGSRVYVRNITFSGNGTTKDRVLRRQMRQMEGSWLSSNAIDQGKVNLERTGFFQNVNVKTTRVPGSPDEVDVNYNVTEANSGSVNFGIGYGTESGVTFQAGLQQNNFLGTGNQFGINAQVNSYQKNLALNYTDPFFTVNGVSLGGKIYYNDFNAKNANISDYTNESYGASLTWGFPFDENNYFNFGLGYDHNKISNTEDYVQINQFKEAHGIKPESDEAIKIGNFNMDLNWTRNTLNRGYFPTAGNYQTASFKFSVPGSQAQYYKAQYDVRQYLPLNKDQTYSLLLRSQLGFGDGYGKTSNGSKQILPFYDNFYAGGFSTLRGFRSNTVGPQAVYGKGSDDFGQATDEAAGGNAMAVASAELIFPVPFASQSVRNQVRTSFFVDGGSVWDTRYPNATSGQPYDYDYRKPMFRASYGAALQWMSPMGPLVFSVAKPIKKYAGDDPEFFTFTIGQTF